MLINRHFGYSLTRSVHDTPNTGLMFKSLTTYYAANTNLFMKFHTNSDLQGRRNGENRHMRNR